MAMQTSQLLKYVVILILLLPVFHHSVNNYHVVTFLLEEANLKKRTDRVPDRQCVEFQYVRWIRSIKSMTSSYFSISRRWNSLRLI